MLYGFDFIYYLCFIYYPRHVNWTFVSLTFPFRRRIPKVSYSLLFRNDPVFISSSRTYRTCVIYLEGTRTTIGSVVRLHCADSKTRCATLNSNPPGPIDRRHAPLLTYINIQGWYRISSFSFSENFSQCVSNGEKGKKKAHKKK